MEIYLFIVLVISFAYITFKEWLHYKERSEMRLLSKAHDMSEYQAYATPTQDTSTEKVEITKEDLIPLYETSYSDVTEK